MNHGDGGKGSGRRNEDVSKVKSNWDLIDWSNKAVAVKDKEEPKMNNYDEEDTQEHDDDSEWTCEMCGGPMYRQAHWSYGQCDDCGARQELESDDY